MYVHLSLFQKEEKCKKLLRSTGRPDIERLIAHIAKMGYFTAPGSLRHHRFIGGLMSHSLEIYYKAMKYREEKIKQGVSPDLMPVDSVIIAALMHDLCKADTLRFNVMTRKVEVVKPSNGHSSRSVRQVEYSGFVLTDIEKDAILWHMGGKKFNEDRSVHFVRYPLSEIIFRADGKSIGEAKRRHHPSC